MSSLFVLLVDDYTAWRNQTRLVLQERPELIVVCEVSNGLEAVQKAGELKPDLILLDIGLPELNGIEAARRIKQVSPGSKIIFLSQENSPEVVQEALSAGAHGYVHKAFASLDLLPAIDAALKGEQFLSSKLKSHKIGDTPVVKAPHGHEVQFYSDDAGFLDGFTRFIATSMEAGDVAVVVATESHRESIAQRLKAQGLDIDAAIRQGTYISLDAAETISTFMVDGMPDAGRYFEGMSGLISAAAKAGDKAHPRVAFCGEGTSLLWAEGKVDAALRIEQLCSQFTKIYDIAVFCAYPLSSFSSEADQQVFQSICAEHSAVYSSRK